MIRAYKIYTGDDGHSHVISGYLTEDLLSPARSIRVKETEPHSSYDWHPAPLIQYVFSLTGTLEFETVPGQTFILKPGEILLAMDVNGSGHKWKLVDDQPWKRAYITFDEETEVLFVEEGGN